MILSHRCPCRLPAGVVKTVHAVAAGRRRQRRYEERRGEAWEDLPAMPCAFRRRVRHASHALFACRAICRAFFLPACWRRDKICMRFTKEVFCSV